MLNGLAWLINILPYHDIGFAIIILTIITRFILFPLTHQTTVTQEKIKRIEPDLAKIKEKHKDNKNEQAKLTMELYKQHRINPFWGFVSLFIQIPVVFALYRVFLGGVNFDPAQLYSFVAVPQNIGVNFLGIFDMTKVSYFWAIAATASHFFQMQVAMPPIKKSTGESKGFKDELARSMSLQMKYVMPFMIFIISIKLAAAVSVYWTTTNVFAIIHAIIVKKKAEKLAAKTA